MDVATLSIFSYIYRNARIKDFLEYMEAVSEGVATAKIQELKDLVSRKPIDRKRGQSKTKFRNC